MKDEDYRVRCYELYRRWPRKSLTVDSLVATLPGARRYRVSTVTSLHGVSIPWIGKIIITIVIIIV